MIFTTLPADAAARRAWRVVSALLGNVMKLAYEQEFEGSSDAWWRVWFYKTDPTKLTIVRIPATDIEAVSDEDAFSPGLHSRNRAMLPVRMKVDLLAMEAARSHTSELTYECLDGMTVRRLQVKKQEQGEHSPMVH